MKLEGAKVDRQRREPSRGAEGAKKGGMWKGGVLLPTGEGFWGGGSVPIQKMCEILGSKWRIFVDS